MTRLTWVGLALVATSLAAPCPVPACSLCGSVQNQQTFRQDMEQAKLVLYGTASNPRFGAEPGAPPGTGVTDFHVTRVLKPDPRDPVIAGKKVIQLPRYLPMEDPKEPPHLVLICSVVDGKI